MSEEKGSPHSPFIVNPKADQFHQHNLSWIDNVGGESPLTLDQTLIKLSPHPEHDRKNLDLSTQLVNLSFSLQIPKFFNDLTTVTYTKNAFLDGTFPIGSKKITIALMVKFYAHLVSMNADYALEIPPQDKERYLKMGLLNSLGQTTELFRQLPLYEGLTIGQKQWDGMKPEDPLLLFYHTAKIIRDNPQHRSCKTADRLIPILEKTIYLREFEQACHRNYSFALSTARRIAEYLLRPSGQDESLMLHSGYHGHTFYANIKVMANKESIAVRVFIHNFNGTAIKMNQQVNQNENDFYPYVLEMTMPRLEKNNKARKNFEPEISQLSAYISMLQLSTAENQHYFEGHVLPKLSKRDKRYVDKALSKLKAQKDLWLNELKNNVLDQQGFFSWTAFRSYLKSMAFKKFVSQQSDKTFEELLTNYKFNPFFLQYLQTLICQDVIYNPTSYGIMLTRNKALEITLPSQPIQRVGNCTVYNLKAALYFLADLDWRNSNDQQALQHFNFDMSMGIIELIRHTAPSNFESQIPDVSTLRVPVPSSKVSKELTKARALRKMGKLKEAQKILQVATQKDSDEGYVFAELGLVFDALKEQDNALEAYLKALELIDDPEIYTNCAIIYMEKKQLNKALPLFEEAVKFNPFSPLIYHNRSLVYYDQKEYQQCLADLNKLIELEPDNAEHYLLRGQLFLDMKELPHGIDDLNKAYEMGLRSNNLYSSAFKLHYMRFKVYYDNEDQADCSANYHHMRRFYLDMLHADKDNPNNIEARNLLHECHKKIQNLEKIQLENKILYWMTTHEDNNLNPSPTFIQNNKLKRSKDES